MTLSKKSQAREAICHVCESLFNRGYVTDAQINGLRQAFNAVR